MNNKSTKTLIKHCNICFSIVKGIVNGFQFFCQIFSMNLNQIVWRIFLKTLKIFPRLFLEYYENILRIFPHKQTQKQ